MIVVTYIGKQKFTHLFDAFLMVCFNHVDNNVFLVTALPRGNTVTVFDAFKSDIVQYFNGFISDLKFTFSTFFYNKS